jgi:hypothetical protein
VKLKIAREMMATVATCDNIQEIWFLVCTGVSERVPRREMHLTVRSVS